MRGNLWQNKTLPHLDRKIIFFLRFSVFRIGYALSKLPLSKNTQHMI
jgi:hypothetical protein